MMQSFPVSIKIHAKFSFPSQFDSAPGNIRRVLHSNCSRTLFNAVCALRGRRATNVAR
jgi:hypothetical protein